MKYAYREKLQKIQLYAHNNTLFDFELGFRRKFGTEMDHLGSYIKKFQRKFSNFSASVAAQWL